MVLVPPRSTQRRSSAASDRVKRHLLVSSRFTQAQIDEFYGIPSIEEVQVVHEEVTAPVEPTVVDEDEWQAEDLNQDGEIDELESMTKKE